MDQRQCGRHSGTQHRVCVSETRDSRSVSRQHCSDPDHHRVSDASGKTLWDLVVWDNAAKYDYYEFARFSTVCRKRKELSGQGMQQLITLSPQDNTLGVFPSDYHGAGIQEMSRGFSPNVTRIDLRGGIFPEGSELWDFMEQVSKRRINLREIDLTFCIGMGLLHTVARTV